MTSPFNITTAADRITLDAQRTGMASFTVTNISASQIRARARVTSPDASIVPWFTIDGEIERVMVPAGTAQYTVKVAAPPTAAPKDYTFSLLMVDQGNPDENFTEGPAVKFTVAPIPLPVPPPPFPWWIVAVAVVVLILIIGVVALIANQNALNEEHAHATGTALALACSAKTLPLKQRVGLTIGPYTIGATVIITFSLAQTNDQGHQTFPSGAYQPPTPIGSFSICFQWSTVDFACNRGAWQMVSGNITAVYSGGCTRTLPVGVTNIEITDVVVSQVIF